ncbi:MAG TPA: hypothetical protein VK151_08550 [Fluviicola sp.]|nr:hypothetical protein [Fluviicola sp.]
MAEFSQEYQTAIGSTLPGDFSIIEHFKTLMEGMSTTLICEGFGSNGIKNVDGRCYLLYWHEEPMLLEDAINKVIDE